MCEPALPGSGVTSICLGVESTGHHPPGGDLSSRRSPLDGDFWTFVQATAGLMSRPSFLSRPRVRGHSVIWSRTAGRVEAHRLVQASAVHAPRGSCARKPVRLSNVIEATVPVGRIHVTLDACATPKHAKVPAWLSRHPRFVFHFTPNSCSRSIRLRRSFLG